MTCLLIRVSVLFQALLQCLHVASLVGSETVFFCPLPGPAFNPVSHLHGLVTQKEERDRNFDMSEEVTRIRLAG